MDRLVKLWFIFPYYSLNFLVPAISVEMKSQRVTYHLVISPAPALKQSYSEVTCLTRLASTAE